MGMTDERRSSSSGASVVLYWLPLGAGDASHCVGWNGRIYEALVSRLERREARSLYHSALEVSLGPDRFVIEMAPEWGNARGDRGVVSGGPVGIPWLGRSRFFRYEVRRWRGGRIPDVSEAVASPLRVSSDLGRAQRVLDLVPAVPAVTWGRDELHAGDMWNSNSLIAWLLSRSAHAAELIEPPPRGRAPGWTAGLVVAARQEACRKAPEGSGGIERSSPDEPGADDPYAQRLCAASLRDDRSLAAHGDVPNAPSERGRRTL
jgi:hypothetical protein